MEEFELDVFEDRNEESPLISPDNEVEDLPITPSFQLDS